MERKIDDERIPYGLAVHDEEEERAVSEVIRNHQTIIGDNVKQFEREIAKKFGKEIGVKQSSAQITHYYSKENLIGKQVIGVCNFPTKNIAGVVSEVLILGAIEKDGKVVLVHPSQKSENGLDIA